MPKTTTPKGIKATPVKREARDDVPQFFRLNVEVGDLDGAIAFYTDLLGVQGRKQPGHRCYFECGPVTLQVVDVSPGTRGEISLLRGRGWSCRGSRPGGRARGSRT